MSRSRISTDDYEEFIASNLEELMGTGPDYREGFLDGAAGLLFFIEDKGKTDG